MNYPEWLRIRNLLRVVGIVLAILVLLGIVLRISVARYLSPDAWVMHMTSASSKVTNSVLPDGTKRTVIDTPSEQTYVVIDDHGYAGKHIVVTEPTKRAHEQRTNVSVGSIHVSESHQGAVTTTVVDTNGSVPMLYYMLLADLVAIIVATILAAPLAREIDGHLEIALTKPISRARYALGAIGVDAVGIISASVMTVVAFYLCQLLFESPRIDFSGVNARAIAMGVACPLAWYALLCALTTWLHRSWVAVLAGAIPVSLVVGVLTLVPTENTIALFLHDVAWVIARLNPLSYVQLATTMDHGTVQYGSNHFGLRLSLEVVFFVVYGAIAVWQWQRVEA